MSLNPPQLDFKLPMSAKTAARMAWGAWILILLGLVTGVVSTLSLVPGGWREGCGAASLIAFLVAAEFRRKLPDSMTMKRISNVTTETTPPNSEHEKTPVEPGPS